MSDQTTADGFTRELADAMPFIVWTHDDDGRVTYFNRWWTEFTGHTLEQTLQAGGSSFVHPDDRASVAPSFDRSRAVATAPISYRLRRKDGEYRWHEMRIVPARTDGDRVTLWVGMSMDIEDRRRAAEAQEHLIEATNVLGTSLDVQRTLADVARLVVPGLADWCAIDLLVGDSEVKRVAVAHVDPSKVDLAWELWKILPPKPTDVHGLFEVVRTRKSELVAEVTDDMLVASISDPELLELFRRLGLRSSICVPLIARDTVLGALSLVTAESGKIYRPRDVAFAEEMARRMAIAIDNARLYEQATHARAAAEAMASEVLEQSKTVEAELLRMRAERDAARAELERSRDANT